MTELAFSLVIRIGHRTDVRAARALDDGLRLADVRRRVMVR